REGGPRVSFFSQRSLGLGDVLPLAFGTQPPKELLLAPVAAVQSAAPPPGARGHCSDRGTRIGDEHLSCSVEDPPVVARRLGPPPAQGRLKFFLHTPHYIWNKPFRSAILHGTERFVPQRVADHGERSWLCQTRTTRLRRTIGFGRYLR